MEVPRDKSQINNNVEISNSKTEEVNDLNTSKIVNPKSEILNHKVSALSMSSIRAKKELEAQLKPQEKLHDELPIEPFTETQMLEQWIKYANRLGDKGYKILESLLLLNDPKLDGTTIIHELPNESSKIDFEGEKHDLLGYLRGKLHNHNVTIDIIINEKIELKKAFTVQEKYERLKGLNPALELLRKTFDLDL
ncbi:DNA polymerase III subunit gamma/tau [Flavobacterium sp.]|uniref:DNA polymerase III subunit gamma/tau n=1 Tax=Flavobacterium sp. TaxID=239 RepID=UPI00286C0DA9|nr:DNA polymerase III subunit gamma/tau [Flavobacterium sp.]